jgi:hypothetical protein
MGDKEHKEAQEKFQEKLMAGRFGPNKGEGGRPWKLDEKDLETLYKLAEIDCTLEEVAEFFNMSVECITKNKTYYQAFKKGKEGGKRSLRRQQHKLAYGGSVPMSIWLGKQKLGQKDKHETETKVSLKDVFKNYGEDKDIVASKDKDNEE